MMLEYLLNHLAMYVNFDLIESKGLSLHSFLLLQACSQNKTEDLGLYMEDNWEWVEMKRLESLGLVEYIKGKKDQSLFSKARATVKGRDLLGDLETPLVTDGDLKMFDYLSSMYLEAGEEGRSIGNKKKTKKYIAIFRARTNLNLHEMYWLCWLFLEEFKYTKVLEYIFFNSNKNRYGTFEGSFDDSPLFQFLDENRPRLDSLWKSKGVK